MMDTPADTTNITDPMATSRLGVGSQLRAAREGQGLAVADIAERIKFSVRQVEALEADDFKTLPEGAFLRGFIRSYARTVHLDETALLTTLSAPNAEHGDVSRVQSGGEKFSVIPSDTRKNLILLSGALLLAILLAVFVWSQQHAATSDKVLVQEIKLPQQTEIASTAVEVSAQSAVVADPMPVSENSSAIVLRESTPPIKLHVEAPVRAVKEELKPAVAVKPKVSETTPVVVPPPVADTGKPQIPLEQLKKRPIHIVFTEEVWMEIKDAKGELLLSRMNPAASEKWIGGNRRAPYQVSIGKASAVKLYYKGREIDLSKSPPGAVARLVLE